MNIIVKRSIFFLLKKIFKPVIILNYHSVSPKYEPAINSPGTWTSVGDFENHLKYLKQNYNVVSLRQFISNDKINGIPVVITFDDGFKTIEDYVVPILEKNKIPATFFINTAYLNKQYLPWTLLLRYFNNSESLRHLLPADFKTLKKELRFTDDSQKYNELKSQIESLNCYLPQGLHIFTSLDFLRTLNTELFTVGLHGHEHQRHSLMSYHEQEENIKKNFEILSDLPAFLPFFSIPYGKFFDWNEETIRICQKFNLKILTASGTINLSGEGILDRIPTDNKDIRTTVPNAALAKIKKMMKK
jgi:peptidoglycan/xylan/chitin deacetylase (PgdA/CDA1 family)